MREFGQIRAAKSPLEVGFGSDGTMLEPPSLEKHPELRLELRGRPRAIFAPRAIAGGIGVWNLRWPVHTPAVARTRNAWSSTALQTLLLDKVRGAGGVGGATAPPRRDPPRRALGPLHAGVWLQVERRMAHRQSESSYPFQFR